jgi:dTMP kinase
VAILIDVDPAEAEVRMAGRTVDRFEQEDRGFHARVRKGFHELAERWPERWVVIDGSGTIEAVAARIAHHL